MRVGVLVAVPLVVCVMLRVLVPVCVSDAVELNVTLRVCVTLRVVVPVCVSDGVEVVLKVAAWLRVCDWDCVRLGDRD